MGWVRVPLKPSPAWLRLLDRGWSTRILIQAPAGRMIWDWMARAGGGC